MVDYIGLNALAAVVKTQGFAPAAKKLCITQSAVSQRIASIENYYGQRLLIRETPYRLSELGEKLLAHLRQVNIIESDLEEWTGKHAKEAAVKIAINRDSLDLWFGGIFSNTDLKNIRLELITTDQNLTLEHLKDGRADLAISSEQKPLSKCESTYIGKMNYQMACSPEYKKCFFSSGFSKANIKKAMAILFDQNDNLHAEYLSQKKSFKDSFPFSLCPSTRVFKQAIQKGHGYGLMPLLDMGEELKSGDIVLLDKNSSCSIELYLHSWQIQSPRLQAIKDAIQKSAKFKKL